MLNEVLEEAIAANDADFGLDEHDAGSLSYITDQAGRNKNIAVMTVVLTLALKKHRCPEQDIRKHQAGMDGGFSARGLDENEVTPFLCSQDFPCMKSGSGWLTRSLAVPEPYSLGYSGAIRPLDAKKNFLKTVDAMQNRRLESKICMLYMLRKLSDWRSKNGLLQLARPMGKTITEIVEMISKHWEGEGASKLPTIAMHATYSRLVRELDKYKGCELLPLLSHTTPDSRAGRTGDIEVRKDGEPFESVEIKHNIAINYALIRGLERKISTSGTNRYYILSTNEVMPEMEKVSLAIMKIHSLHGCQVIPNGVASTIKYYLRMLTDTDAFVRAYVDLIEKDKEISFELKRKWNDIVNNAKS